MSTFEDDACDASEFLINKMSRYNATGIAKDETKTSGVSNPIPRCGIEHQMNTRRRLYGDQIGVHQGKNVTENTKEWKSSTDKNILMYNRPVNSKEKSIDVVERNTDRHNVSSSVSGVIITTPLIQNLESNGVLLKSAVTTKSVKEFLMKKTETYLAPILRKYTVKGVATPYGDNIVTVETQKTKVHNMLAQNDNKTTTGKYIKSDIVNDGFSNNENEEVLKSLDEAVKDFNEGNNNGYLSFGRSNTKFQQNPTSEEMRTRRILKLEEMCKSRDIKTLGDALTHFGLSFYLEELEKSLEDVRRNIKTKEDHVEFFKQIDKEIQKLSFKFHPDRVINGGGTDEEIATAQSLQTAINATRTVLTFLNSAFLEDIGTDHKFGFYTKLSISSLNNEDEVKYRIYEVIFKIGVISRIKQQNIISEIRKFLTESKNCVQSYIDDKKDFEKYRDLAFFHLKCCIKGFKKLCSELEEVKDQCRSEKNGENMHSLIQNMAKDSKKDLQILKLLEKTAISSLNGNYQFFSPVVSMDPYFVLPLVSYTNVILMCNVMVRSSSFLDKLNTSSESAPYFRNDLGHLMHAYYLASYCSGNKYYEGTVLEIMGKMHLIEQGFRPQISKKEIESEFIKLIKNIDVFMEYEFKVEDYTETITTNLLVLDLKKCMTMMTEFQEKQQELSKGIKEFQKKTEKLDEKYQRFDKIMEASEQMNREVQERLEQSKKLSKKISCALSDQQ